MSFHMNHVMFKVSQLVKTRGASDNEEQREQRKDFAFKKLVEEVGEFSKAMNQPKRCDEPAESELADVLLCVIDLVHQYTGGDPYEWITDTLSPKLLKWGSQVLTPESLARWEFDIPKKTNKVTPPINAAFGSHGSPVKPETPVQDQLISGDTQFHFVGNDLFVFGERLKIHVQRPICDPDTSTIAFRDIAKLCGVTHITIDDIPVAILRGSPYSHSEKYLVEYINNALSLKQGSAPKKEPEINGWTCSLKFNECTFEDTFVQRDMLREVIIAEHKHQPKKEVSIRDVCHFDEAYGSEHRYIISGHEGVTVTVKSSVSMPQSCTLKYLLEGYEVLGIKTEKGFYRPVLGCTIEKSIFFINKFLL